MLSKDQRIDPTLHWPDAYDRTDAEDRERYPGDLEPTRKESIQSIVEEIGHWGGLDVRLSTASQHYADRPNVPHQHDKPDDVGVVAYYLQEGGTAEDWHAIACDCWETQRENARAIALWARRMRLAERCGVTTAQSTHAASALPSGEDDDAIVATGSQKPAHEVLGVDPDAPDATVRGAYRELLKERHPDHGGSQAAFTRLQESKEVLLDGDD